ncbi:MAG: hypothetical protein ACRDO7_10200 [Nocardioidaceae bacterium]
MNHQRKKSLVTATAAIAAIAVCAAPGNGAEEQRPAPARAASNLDLSPANSLWYVKGHTYQRKVSAWITRGTTWRDYDGKPLQVHYRPVDGGAWRLAGTGRQHAGPNGEFSRGTVRFTIAETGKVNLRVRARVDGRWRVHKPRRYSRVTEGPVAYDPKPIRRINLGEHIALGWKRSYFAHGLGFGWEYPELNVRKGLAGDDDFYTSAVQPDSADTANRLVYSKAIIRGEDVYGTRVQVLNPLTGRKRWVSFHADGTRTPFTWDPSISDTGRWIAYASTDRHIVPGSPKGDKVFVTRMRPNTKESRYIGRGSRTGISGNGRYVVWVHNDTVRRWDRRTGDTVTVAQATRGIPGAPKVSDNGRYVTFSQLGEATPRLREIVTIDLRTDESTIVSTGQGPVMTDDGRYIAFRGPGHTEYGFTDVARWDRRAGEVTIVSVGPDGTGTDNPTDDIDMSDNGRWIVASFGNYREPGGPNVTLVDGVIYDMHTVIATG